MVGAVPRLPPDRTEPEMFLIPATGVILILSCTDSVRLAGLAGLLGITFDGAVDPGTVVMLFSSARLAVLSGEEMGGRALFHSRLRYEAWRSSITSRPRRRLMKYAPDPTMVRMATMPKTMRMMLVVPIPFLGGGGGGVLGVRVGAVETPGVVFEVEGTEVVVFFAVDGADCEKGEVIVVDLELTA